MRKVLLLTIGMFALGFDAYVLAGLLPDIRTTFHISDAQTGQTISIFTLCYALAAPIFAALLAGKPARRILIWALAIFSAANAISALSTHFSVLLFSRALAGLGAGLYSPLASASAASLVSPEKRGRALGLTLGGMSMGTVIGVPLGLLVAEKTGWQGALWLVAALGLVAMIGVIFRFPDFPASAPPSLRERFGMLTDKQVTATVGITFTASVASLGLYTYLAVILHDLREISSITPYLWGWGIGGLIGSFSIGRFIDRTGRPGLLMSIILISLAAAMFSIPIGLESPISAFLPFILWGAAGWASQAPQQHVLLLLQPRHGAAAVALNSSANYLGGAVGSALGGMLILTGLKPSCLPFAAGCLVLAALLGQFILVSKRKKRLSSQYMNCSK